MPKLSGPLPDDPLGVRSPALVPCDIPWSARCTNLPYESPNTWVPIFAYELLTSANVPTGVKFHLCNACRYLHPYRHRHAI